MLFRLYCFDCVDVFLNCGVCEKRVLSVQNFMEGVGRVELEFDENEVIVLYESVQVGYFGVIV